MPDEEYIRLPVSDQLPRDIDFVSLHDDGEGFRIIVESRMFCILGIDKRIRRWAISCWKPTAYRNADEGKRLKSLDLSTHGAGVYAVKNSSLAKWLHGEWLREESESNLEAWALVTINDWIEVVGDAPEVKEIVGDES